MRYAVSLLVALLVAALAYLSAAFALQRTVLFQPPFADPAAGAPPGARTVALQLGRGTVEAWHLPSLGGQEGPAPALLFAHGNAELIDTQAPLFDEPRAWGMSVLLVEYPGYGRSAGSPSEASIDEAMRAAYDHLATRPEVDAGRIVGFGRSLGAAAAAALATRRPLAALVLQSGFRSVPSMARRMLVPGFLIRDRFDSTAALADAAMPVLIVHGEHDTVVPVDHAAALHAAAPRSRILLLNCGHNDCPPDWGTYWREVHDFLVEHGVLP